MKVSVGSLSVEKERGRMETPHQLLKERQRRERAELILEAAEAVFTEKGYHEASIDEIALRVGVAKGTLYQHFASKEELVFALFESQIETILEEGKAAGEFEMSIATGVMLTMFFSLLSPRGYEWLVEHEGLTPQELVAQVGHTYFHGIQSREHEK